jgi:hypothetical protein
MKFEFFFVETHPGICCRRFPYKKQSFEYFFLKLIQDPGYKSELIPYKIEKKIKN